MDESFSSLVARARAAAAAYYNGDELLMPDSKYDALVEKIARLKAEHPEWDDEGLLSQVAGGVGKGDARHSSPMLSLDKVKTEDNLIAFLAGLPPNLKKVMEPKLDGLAINATYRRGILTQVVTRGDGTAGEDVTAQADAIQGLPKVLRVPEDMEVRGECYMTDQDFDIANTLRIGAGKPAFANPRNAVAGTLRAKDRDYEAPMTFAGYEALWASGGDSYRARMAYARDLGISVTLNLIPELDGLEPLEAVRRIG